MCDCPENGVENGTQISPEILSQKPEHEAAAFLEQPVLAPVASVGDRIG